MDQDRISVTQRLSRRDVLIRALAIGSVSPAIAGLLAACGPMGDDNGAEQEETATAPPESRSATETPTASPTREAATPTARDLTSTSTPVPTATPAPTEAPFPPDPDRHFQITTWLPVVAMNPHVQFRKSSWVASRLALEPLFEFDADLNPVLILAEEWPAFDYGLLDPEGRWVTWKLRRNVRWHDGEIFDADDVIATWHFATDTTGAIRTTRDHFELVTDIERIDDHTVTIHFSEPNPNWIDIFRGGDGVILPGHVFEPLIGEQTDYQDEMNLEMPGTGPWKVTSFDLSSGRVRFECFENYWQTTASVFDTIEIEFLNGDGLSNAGQVLVTGDADYAPGLEVPDQESLARMASESSTGQLVTLQGLAVETLFLNFADPRAQPDERRAEADTSHPLLSDLRVRRALSLAIPREQIAEIYGAYGEPFVHPLAAPEKYHGRGFPAEPDLARARALLGEAGFEGGTLLIQTSVNSVRQQVQDILAAAFEELGFTVELKAIDAGVFFSSDRNNPDTLGHFYADLQLYTPAYGTSPYPLEWAERFRSDRIASAANGWEEPNISRYANPEFDRLHDQAKIEMDPARQVELWRAIMNILIDDVVVIPLLRRDSLAAVNNRFQPAGFSPWAIAPSWNLQHWTVNE